MTLELPDTTPSTESESESAPGRFRPWWQTYGWAWAWFAVCVLARFPNLLWGANPYAEEGVVYYAYAAEHSVVSTLGFRFNYYSIVANITAAVEAALPISMLRWVSPLAGLIGPTVVVALIARQRQPRWRVALAIAVTVFTVSMEREWFSVIHAQFWFAAAIVVMIGAFGSTPSQRRTDYAIAFVAGLSGLIAVMAVPGLIAETLRQRRRDRSAARHLGVVTALLVVTSVMNRLVTVPRKRSMPFDELIPTAFLKMVWQPITGAVGDSVGIRLMGGSPVVANIVGLVGFAAVGGALALALRGRWLVSAITAVFVSTGAIVFSLPPSSILATTLGGRYALAGAVPLGVALAMGTSRRRRALPGVSDRLSAHLPTAQRVALVASMVWVLAAVHSGWLTSTWMSDPDLNNTANLVSSTRQLGRDDTGTVQIESVCRLAPNPIESRAGLSIETAWQPDGSLRIKAQSADINTGQPVGLFVWATTGAENFRVDTSGNQLLEGYTYGLFTDDLPGTCYPFSDNLAPATSFTDQTVVTIPASAFTGLDPLAFVRVGVGTTINDALALHNFRFAGLVSEAAPDGD